LPLSDGTAVESATLDTLLPESDPRLSAARSSPRDSAGAEDADVVGSGTEGPGPCVAPVYDAGSPRAPADDWLVASPPAPAQAATADTGTDAARADRAL